MCPLRRLPIPGILSCFPRFCAPDASSEKLSLSVRAAGVTASACCVPCPTPGQPEGGRAVSGPLGLSLVEEMRVKSFETGEARVWAVMWVGLGPGAWTREGHSQNQLPGQQGLELSAEEMAELSLAGRKGQLHSRWSRHLDRSLQVGWSLAEGQPVETEGPMAHLVHSLGVESEKCCSGAGRSPWPRPSGLSIPASLASRTRWTLLALPADSCRPAKGRVDSEQHQGPGEASIPEVSGDCSVPTSASRPLSRAPFLAPGDPPGLYPALPPPLLASPRRRAGSLVLSPPLLEFIYIKAGSLLFSTQQGCGD